MWKNLRKQAGGSSKELRKAESTPRNAELHRYLSNYLEAKQKQVGEVDWRCFADEKRSKKEINRTDKKNKGLNIKQKSNQKRILNT